MNQCLKNELYSAFKVVYEDVSIKATNQQVESFLSMWFSRCFEKKLFYMNISKTFSYNNPNRRTQHKHMLINPIREVSLSGCASSAIFRTSIARLTFKKYPSIHSPMTNSGRLSEPRESKSEETCVPARSLRLPQSELSGINGEDVKDPENQLLLQMYSEQNPYPFKVSENDTKKLDKFYSGMLSFCAQNGLPYPFHLGYYLPADVSVSPQQYYREMVVYMISSHHEFGQLPLYVQLAFDQVIGVGAVKYAEIQKAVFDGKLTDLFSSLAEVTRRYVDVKCVIDRNREWNAFQLVRREKLPNDDVGREVYVEHCDRDLGLIRDWNVKEDVEVFDSLYENGFGYPTVVVSDNDRIFLANLQQFAAKGRNFQERMSLDMLPMLVNGATPKEIEEALALPIEYVKYVLSLMVRFGLCSFNAVKRERNGKFAFVVDQNVITSLKNPKLLGVLFGQNITRTNLEAVQASLNPEPTARGRSRAAVLCESLANVFGAVADYEGRFQGMFPTQALADPLKLTRLAWACDGVISLLSGDVQGFRIPGVVSLTPMNKLIASPWMLLYTVTSFCQDNCPPIYIWPKGAAVKELPSDFLGYTHVRILSWKPYRSLTCDISSVLQNVQKLLETTGVLVVGYLAADLVPKTMSFPDPLFDSAPEEFMLDSLIGVVSYTENKQTLERKIMSIQYGIPINNTMHCAACLVHMRPGENSCFNVDKWEEIAKKEALLSEKISTFLINNGMDSKQPKQQYHFSHGKLLRA